MAFLNHKGTDRLRRGRVSIPGATYFVTICTANKRKTLTNTHHAQQCLAALKTAQQDSDLKLHYATVMPDHIHVLFVLGARLTLSQPVAKLKTLTTKETTNRASYWQDNYFDHRLRVETSLERFARYIMLNPYRKGLLQLQEVWPWWLLDSGYQPAFLELLDKQKHPRREWLCESEGPLDLIAADLDAERRLV